MTMTRFRILVSTALILFVALCAPAMAEIAESPTLDAIRTQQIQMRSDAMAGKDAFADMPKHKVGELVRRQTELLAMIEGKASVDELNEHDKTTAFNTLEWIKATVTDAEEERIVCERHRPVGSNRVQRSCTTVAERRYAREEAAKALSLHPLCMGEGICGKK